MQVLRLQSLTTMDTGVYNYHTPKVEFTEPRKVAYLYLANATVAAQYTSRVENYWFKAVVTGYLKNAEGGSVEQTLIEGEKHCRRLGEGRCSSLGEVDELRFKVQSNDMSGNRTALLISVSTKSD